MAMATVSARVAAQWARVKARLKIEFGETTYARWLSPLTLVGLDGPTVRLAAQTRFMRDWIQTHYGDRIKTLWLAEAHEVRGVELVVKERNATRAGEANGSAGDAPTSDEKSTDGAVVEDKAAAQPGKAAAVPSTSSSPKPVGRAAGFEADTKAEPRDELGANLDPRFTFENFVVGKSNELAYAAARRAAEASAVPFNPLFLYGGVGLGKTHLMHAIAWAIRAATPARRVIYLSAEKFMFQFIRALRHKDTMAFKQQFRSVDVLMVDDVQFISGKDLTQEEFFHTFNALVDQNRQIIISADKSPSDLDGLEERMRSRLGWGLVADIHPTTYELRLGILQSKAEHMGVAVPFKVMEFLAHKITSNVRELEGALNRIIAHATLVGRPVTGSSPRRTACAATDTTVSRWTVGSRTTPSRTRSRPASNCGLTSATMEPPSAARHEATAASTRRSEMNDTSIVASDVGSPTAAAESARAFVRSWTTTRGSRASRSTSWPRPTSMAWTRLAPRRRRTSVNPPVEAPTSRQTRPFGSTPSGTRAPTSLSPPREAWSGPAATAIGTASATRSPGFRSRRAPSPSPTRTRPASTSAWARARDSTSPRSTRS